MKIEGEGPFRISQIDLPGRAVVAVKSQAANGIVAFPLAGSSSSQAL